MSITLDVPEDLAKELAVEAGRQGLPLSEYALRETCAQQHLREKSFVHAFSAASCWAQAGNFYEAIALCDQLFAEHDVPASLRARIEQYANTLRTRRAQWYGELVHQSAEGP